jgi:hypothetical protein
MFKPIQRAATGTTKEGVFSPAQLLAAIKRNDPTKDKAAFARGAARLQEFGEQAQKVIGDTVPDSGTAGRAAMMHMIGAMGAEQLDPRLLAGGAALALPYTRPGAAAARFAVRSPQARESVSKAVRRGTPAAAQGVIQGADAPQQ